jgi:hypothetical protein
MCVRVLGLMETLECVLVMADPIRYGDGFSGLGVVTNQTLTSFKIWLLGVLGHFLATTWQSMTGPRGDLSLAHVTSAMLACHVTCRVAVCSAMWLYGLPRGTFPLVHGFDRQSPKMSDMWQPLVLPHHHADINMKHITLFVCHVHCTNDDIICTDADINNTNADSSLLIGLG